MADTIKGLTAKIGADTSDFLKEMKKVDKQINTLNKTADELQKGLELEFNPKNLEQAQKQVQEALELTNKKAEALRVKMKKIEESGQVDSESYGKLQLELAKSETQATKLQKKLDKLNNQQLTETAEKVEKIGNKITAVGKAVTVVSALTTAALTTLTKLASSTLEYANDLDAEAKSVNMSASALQEWIYVAGQCDVESSQLEKAITKVQSAYSDLASGTTTTQNAVLSSLGIIAGEYESNEDLFNAVIESLSAIEDQTTKVSLANDLFGENLASDLLPLLNAETSEIEALQEEYSNLNALNDEQITSLSALSDKLDALKTNFTNLGYQIAASLQPVIENLIEYVNNNIIPAVEKLVDWFNSLSESQQTMLVKGLAITAMAGPLILMIGKITSGVGSLMDSLGSNGGLISVLKNLQNLGIVAVIAAVAAALVYLYTTNEDFRESVNGLFNAIKPLFTLISQIFTMIVDMISTALEPTLDVITGIVKILSGQFQIAINGVMTCLIPVMYVLEAIYKFAQSIITVLKDLFSFKWGSISSDLKSIWSDWDSTDFAKEVIANWSTTSDAVDETSSSAAEITSGSSSTTTNTTTSNDTYNVTVNIESNDYLDTDDLVSQISKKLAIKVQSRS